MIGALIAPQSLVGAQSPTSATVPVQTENLLVAVGKDMNGTPFLLSSAGTKGRYLFFTNNRMKIELAREESFGTIDYRRLGPKEVEVSFYSPQGNLFCVRTKISRGTGKTERITTRFRFNHSEVTLDNRRDYVGSRLESKKERELERLFAGVTSDGSMTALTREVQPFLTRASLKRVATMSFFEGGDCANDLSDCIVAAIEYFGSLAALMGFCGATLGIGCVFALIAHPALAIHLGLKCGKAAQSCGLAE